MLILVVRKREVLLVKMLNSELMVRSWLGFFCYFSYCLLGFGLILVGKLVVFLWKSFGLCRELWNSFLLGILLKMR